MPCPRPRLPCHAIRPVQHENGENRSNLAEAGFEVAKIGPVLTRTCVNSALHFFSSGFMNIYIVQSLHRPEQ